MASYQHVRRTQYACFYLEDAYRLDLGALLRAELPAPAPDARVFAFAILTGERHEIARQHLDLLLSLPSGCWVRADRLDQNAHTDLVEKGFLVSDAASGRLKALRERDESLSGNEWNLYAALYHYLTQWSAVDIRDDGGDEVWVGEETDRAALAFVAEHGPPPGEFAKIRSSRTVPLPGIEREGALYRTLTSRRTTRSFDTEVPMTLEQLDTVLRYVFGCHGYATKPGGIVCIKRTSPSGGGLHPIEAYPIVSHVASVEPGIYHYDVRDHALGLLAELEPAEARQLSTSFMCGQSYFGAAHVSFVLTARFYRNHWKYRRHQRAYAGVLMDAAHLSQTLYVVSGELGLGAFVTIAINGRDIEARLGLDGISEGVLLMTGCGPRTPGDSPLELRFSPDRPG